MYCVVSGMQTTVSNVFCNYCELWIVYIEFSHFLKIQLNADDYTQVHFKIMIAFLCR